MSVETKSLPVQLVELIDTLATMDEDAAPVRFQRTARETKALALRVGEMLAAVTDAGIREAQAAETRERELERQLAQVTADYAELRRAHAELEDQRDAQRRSFLAQLDTVRGDLVAAQDEAREQQRAKAKLIDQLTAMTDERDRANRKLAEAVNILLGN
jgi:chromosome segregation ATPase